MMRYAIRFPLLVMLVMLALLVSCEESTMTVEQGTGPDPVLPNPDPPPTPVINVSQDVGWADSQLPVAASGFHIREFAGELDHPRWLYVLPNGDVLVAETNAPARPDVHGPVEGVVVSAVKYYMGTGGESADRITLLRDTDGDGRADTRSVFLENLNSPFGMVLVDDMFYVANTDALWRFPYAEGLQKLSQAGTKVVELPAGDINYHWTKNVVASADGSRLFVTTGSNSNIGERGMDKEENRALIFEVDPETGSRTVYAGGLRNPNGLAIHPDTQALWTTVNERDNLGNDLAPDYMTAVQRNAFFGWPWRYFGNHVDPRVSSPESGKLDNVATPDYALGPHTAPLGLVFYTGNSFPDRYAGGAFVALHGSYNRIPKSGYRVVFVPFAEGRPQGLPEDIITGFLNADSQAQGRPAGLAMAQDGALLIADDTGGKIWYLQAEPQN